MKTLILYYSRTGNTEFIAKTMAAVLHADCEALIDAQSYSGIIGFMRGGHDAIKERKADLKPLTRNPPDYDLIIIGQPVWAARPVPTVNALVQQQDLFRGKNVALFATYDGSWAEECLDRTAAKLQTASIVSRMSFLKVGKNRAENEQRAREWAVALSAK